MISDNAQRAPETFPLHAETGLMSRDVPFAMTVEGTAGASRVMPASPVEEFLRRALDIVVSAVALALLFPVMLVIGLLIRIESPGPAIFRALRIGMDRRRRNESVAHDRRRENLHGQPFLFCKFRTMYADSRERFPQLYDYRHSPEDLARLPMKILMGHKGKPERLAPESVAGGDGMMNDPRVPAFCRWLRTTSLDELPNLWNVLKGDMHLVGPRPDLPEHVPYYDAQQTKKLRVKPGVTGLAQVSGRGLLTFQETLEYDVRFVENRSLWLDLKVILKTFRVFFNRIGAY